MGSSLFQTTSKIVALSRSCQIISARKLFDEMSHRDSIAWNAMLTSYSQLGLSPEALNLFSEMRVSGVPLDDFSFTAALSSSSDAGELYLGRKIHGLVICHGYQSSLPVYNSLLDMYGKCLVPSSAERVFEEMSVKNNVSWCSLLYAYVKTGDFENGCRVFVNMPDRVVIACNILMAGYARFGKFELCVDLFRKMRGSTCEPDLWTFTALMNACAELSETRYGRMIHGCIVKSSWSSEVELNNSILSFYAKQSCCEDAVEIFKSIKTLTQVSWNAMIDAHMKIGEDDKALALFQQSPEKNLVSWTSMITGYVRNGQGEQALGFFIDMIRNYLRPDGFSFGAVLHACSSLAIQGHGRMIHSSVIHYGFHSYAYVGIGLVNMYAKCGDIEASSRAFNDIREKDLVSWNAMLFGFGLHGRAIEALTLYEEMVTSKVNPDKVTFIGLLMTCSHSGLIERGKMIFESMGSVYGLQPEADHVACMVDMLGRGGYFKQAKELVEEYSRRFYSPVGESLLGAFASPLGEVGLGVKIGKDLMNMDPRNEMGYVLLSNLYCANGQWKEAEKVRKLMMEQGVKKTPGCSWIEVRDKVMVFVAGNHSHPHMKEMYEILNFIEPEMRNPTYFGFQNYKAFHVIMMKNSLCSFARNQMEMNASKLIYMEIVSSITDKTKTRKLNSKSDAKLNHHISEFSSEILSTDNVIHF